MMKKFFKKIAFVLSFSVCIFSGCDNIDNLPLDYSDLPNDLNSSNPVEIEDISSVRFVEKLRAGWNLGNTLDAVPNETSWGNPPTTKAMIDAVQRAGFKTIRIPISWHNHVRGSAYRIDPAWLARVKQIVDWAYNDGMYVIINIHHDNMSIFEINSSAGFSLSNDAGIQAKSEAYIRCIWTQIARAFNNSYDERLIFEILNEPRDVGGKVWGNEWWVSGTSAQQACKIITQYEAAAIKAIRASGGNNEKRFIMVPGYAGSANASLLNSYTLPSDTAFHKLILEAHAYSPYDFAMGSRTNFTSSDKSEIDGIFRSLDSMFMDKGVGVVIDETGANDKNNLSERIKWAEYFFGKGKAYGIPVVLWDNNVTQSNGGNPSGNECYGYFNRSNLTWYFPSLTSAIIRAY